MISKQNTNIEYDVREIADCLTSIGDHSHCGPECSEKDLYERMIRDIFSLIRQAKIELAEVIRPGDPQTATCDCYKWLQRKLKEGPR